MTDDEEFQLMKMKVLSFVVAALVIPTLGSGQTPAEKALVPDNAFVIHAESWQTTTTAPIRLTLNDYFFEKKKRMVRRSVFMVPATDMLDGLLSQVIARCDACGFGELPATERLFVLDVRSRNIPATTSEPYVFTLASGLVITVPHSVIHNPATGILRNLLSNTGPGAVVGTTSIVDKCAKDWPDDFQMRRYCEEQQNAGAAALLSRIMTHTADHRTIRAKCERDWPDDYRMRNYCEEQQLKALGK